MGPLIWEIPLILGLIGIGFCLRWYVERMRNKNRDSFFARIFTDNREFDGTLFTFGILVAFLSVIFLTYLNPEYAELTTTGQVIEVVKMMFNFMAGYLFRKVSESPGNGDKKQETEQK